MINGTAPFSFIFENDTTSLRVFNDLPTGEFLLAVVDRFLCTDAVSINIPSPDQFIIDLGDDRDVLLGESVMLTVNSNDQIERFDWSQIPNDPACPNCLESSFIPIEDIILQLTATNVEGCTSTDEISIEVDLDYSVYIPNSFSPNGDNINDNFSLFAREGLIDQVEEFMVFDRWGNLLFETQNLQANDPDFGWDGRFNGQVVNDDQLVYSAKIRFIDQTTEIVSGTFTIFN